MLIGELVKKSGLTKDTIRYYEKIGIFNSRVVQRNPKNGYKNYSEDILEVVKMLEIGKQHGWYWRICACLSIPTMKKA